MLRFSLMFSNRVWLAIALAAIVGIFGSSNTAFGGDPPIVVTNTLDSGPGSLRAAIDSAFGGARIHFNIPDSDPNCETNGTCTIELLTPLPPLSDNGLVLDGFTNPGATPNTLGPGELINTTYDIFLDGSSIVDDADGLQISANNVTVRGIVINNFSEDGISIGFSATGAKIEGNALFLNESDGVSVSGDFNTIGGTTNAARNLMSINGDDGINLSGDGNLVQNNLVGLHPEEPEAVPNGAAGIHIFGRDNTVGGSTAGRNVISGNANSGIRIGPSLGFVAQGFVTPSGNTVSYNYIGTDPLAASALPNEGPGISIGLSEDSFIGPSNVISGNGGDGVSIGASALRVSMLNNRIGTNAAGNNDIPNAHGVGVYGGADTTIGGPLNGHGNLISGNTGNGIIVSFAGDVDIGGNLIGTTANGQAALGNGSYGVFADNATDVGIGGNFGPNTIAFNGLDGVAIGGMSASIGIISNSIYANTLLGIDIGGGNVTPNDALDADLGPNNTQNFPDLESAITSDNVAITGTMRGTPGANLRIEFFRNEDCDPSGFGEGEDYLGSIQRTIDGDGVLPFAVTSEGSIPAGQGITATATDLQLLQTSEFSNCVIIQGTATPTPTVSPTPTPTDTGTATPTATGETATPTPTPTDTGTATPTPTPTEPDGLLWGDTDCDGVVNPVDALKLLRHDAGLSVTQEPGCPAIGDTIPELNEAWGDWDCDTFINPVDALKTLRHDAGLQVSQQDPCPDFTQPVP